MPHMMHFEVEQKFPVADLTAVRQQLTELGAACGEPVLEVECYFAHPARDFGQTDEALRIRRAGSANFITYKGPKLDASTKTRRELELPLADEEEAARQFAELLVTLGFRPLPEVRKRRRRAKVRWQAESVEVTLDDVEGVGLFVELELMVAEEAVEGAKACLASLAARLGLSGSERRSYLELLLAAKSA
jgi:adenylate cyclase class 2